MKKLVSLVVSLAICSCNHAHKEAVPLSKEVLRGMQTTELTYGSDTNMDLLVVEMTIGKRKYFREMRI